MARDIVSNFPKLSQPAIRALLNAGVEKLEDLVKFTEKEIAALHGMGPSALRELKAALKALGLTFK